MNSNIFVLSHGSCQDGLGGKYAAWTKFGDNATYFPVSYGDPMPSIPDGSEVYIIDFSYDKATLETLNARCSKVVVLDHHKTAEAALKDLDFAFFDMTRSGAVMAWNYFHPEEEVPAVLLRIQDRDLWQWKFGSTKAVTSAMQTLGDDMHAWHRYVDSEYGIEDLEPMGNAIESYKDSAIQRACRLHNVTFRVWKGFNVAIVNSNDLQSDIGAFLYEKYPVDFVVIYSLNNVGTVNIGLRSKQGLIGADVSEVAKLYGGGGHKNSAGCSTSLEVLAEWYESPIFLVSHT